MASTPRRLCPSASVAHHVIAALNGFHRSRGSRRPENHPQRTQSPYSALPVPDFAVHDALRPVSSTTGCAHPWTRSTEVEIPRQHRSERLHHLRRVEGVLARGIGAENETLVQNGQNGLGSEIGTTRIRHQSTQCRGCSTDEKGGSTAMTRRSLGGAEQSPGNALPLSNGVHQGRHEESESDRGLHVDE